MRTPLQLLLHYCCNIIELRRRYTVQSQVIVQIQTKEFYTSHCTVTDDPFPLNRSWDLVGAGCCKGLWEEEEGEGKNRRGSFVGRLKDKGRTSTW